MKAVVYHQYGLPDVLHFEKVEQPTPMEDEVLIKVHASSINDWDWGFLTGTPFVNRTMNGLFKPKKTKILGTDVAGKVEAVGNKVTQFQPGDEVLGDLCECGFGCFSEYVCAKENTLALKPASMSFKQAAAIPQAAALALQGVQQVGQIQPGQKVLINGAGGGAGSFGVQMAKSFGAEVTGVDSGEKLDMMRSIGADHVIDYKTEDFTKNGKSYDLILDNAAYHSFFDYKRVLAPQGNYAVVGGSLARIFQILALGKCFSMIGSKKFAIMLHKPNKDIALIIELFEAGKFVPIIDRTYPLGELAEALTYFGEGHAKGKIVITMEE